MRTPAYRVSVRTDPGKQSMKTAAFVIASLLGLIALASNASAERRIALVIGNGAYQNVSVLPNPGSDGRLISETLTALGFETTLEVDADQQTMKNRILEFGRTLRSSGPDTVGLFYYAGHGIQARGLNFLIPVEATLVDEADLDLVGVEADWVLRQMESAGNHTNIIVLDACRDNPLKGVSRSASRGLAQIDAPTGSFIAYATAPGDIALDGSGDNSPFTLALAQSMQTPGTPIEQVFKQVRVNVIRATDGMQTPWDSSSLVQDFYFSTAAPKPAARNEPRPVELSLWESVSKSNDPGRIALFLQIFPDSQFAGEADRLLVEAMANDPTAIVGSAAATKSDAKTSEPATVAVEAPEQLSEHDLIARAQSSGQVEDYQAYITAYPNGVFADLAQAEVAHLTKDDVIALNSQPATPKQRAVSTWTFDTAIKDGGNVTVGRSLRDLARGVPEFPPIEGLDRAIWANKQCSNCHNWSEANLCDQGAFYATKPPEALRRILHPFGGVFKNALSRWQADGCK